MIKGKLTVKKLKGGYGFFVISSRSRVYTSFASQQHSSVGSSFLEITSQRQEGKLSEENRRLSRNG